MMTTNIVLLPMDKISMIGIWVKIVLYGVKVLIMMSTLLILLTTGHVGASLQQLLNEFVYVPADYSKVMLNETMKMFTQDFIIIILEAAFINTDYSAITIAAYLGISLYGSEVPSLTISVWVLNIILNVSVTIVIVGHL
ncbi:hypothetical protein HD554DRAFT_2035202 [Boletus coccyginus]|nr:hypothetical protein HD554DRAFT_2035202 [Boletus coccyginus]